MNKLMNIKDAVSLINDGDTVALGGNVLHRAPMTFVREMARQGKKELRIVKTAGAHDVDLLCAMGCVKTVDAGFISYESKFGLARHYRKGVESGSIKANEHACYTVISALRGAMMNVPFMPVYGLKEGDLLVENDYFVVVEDPFGGDPVTLVKTIRPDFGIIHVHECDINGNARIYGPKFEDILISRAANKIIITTEQIVPESKMRLNSEYVDIPGFLVTAVVKAPLGASPGSCYKKYDIDEKSIRKFLSIKEDAELSQYLQEYEKRDYAGERMYSL